MDKTLISPQQLQASATAGLNRIPLGPQMDGEFLLQQLAWQSLSAKAGFQLNAQVEDSNPAPEDELPPLPRQATKALAILLRQGNTEGIFELLQLSEKHNYRISAALLPSFLDWALRSSISGKRLYALIDQRGQWLAAKHPEWQALLPLSDEVWESGSLAEQISWLSQIRRTNPERARDLLAMRSPEVNAKTQANLLASLQIGLSLADEEILEEAFHHKRKEVRQQAAMLLCQLPGSKFAQQLQTFTGDLLADKKNFALQLSDDELHLLKGFELARLPKPKISMGEKAGYLSQLVSIIPLGFWEVHFKKSPSALVNRASKSDQADWLTACLLMASVHQARSDWAYGLLEYIFLSIRRDSPELIMNWLQALPEGYLPGLCALLSNAEWEKWLRSHLSFLNNSEVLAFWIRFFRSAQRMLPDNIAMAFAQRLVKILQKEFHASFSLRQSFYHLPTMVQWFPVSTYLALAQLWATDPFEHYWYQDQLEAALKRLSFRYDLALAFEE